MPETVRVLVSGATGRMGATLGRLIGEDLALELVGGLDRDEQDVTPPEYPAVRTLEQCAELLESAQVIIDFSAPAFLNEFLTTHANALKGRAIVVGTTGLGVDEEALLSKAADTSPVLVAANFSVGVNVLLSLVERAARALDDGYEVEIVEAHHRRKEDAPSGTALALGQAVAAGRAIDLESVRTDGRTGRPGARPAGEVGFHSIRGGSIVGEHDVMFIGDMDRIELVHRASDRSLFAAGALRAARWLAGRPAGRYTMRDVLGLD